MTVRVIITRMNVNEGENAQPVHAPYFPAVVKENLWLMLTDKPHVHAGGRRHEPNIHGIERVLDQSRIVKKDIRFVAPPKAGAYAMELQVISDSYVGLDEVIPIEFTVRPAAELPEYVPHQEDVDLDNEPTVFEQMLSQNEDPDSSDDDEPAAGAAAAAAEAKKSQ